MFKPQYGYCKFCDKPDQLIVVKAGYCQKCNHNIKEQRKKAVGKKTGGYKYKRKATGEKETFHAVLDSIPDDQPTKCFVCGEKISVITVSNMAHVLSKKMYPDFRNNPDNIRVLCHRIVATDDGFQGCHYSWDFTPHSELKGEGWDRMKKLETELKQEYNKSVGK